MVKADVVLARWCFVVAGWSWDSDCVKGSDLDAECVGMMMGAFAKRNSVRFIAFDSGDSTMPTRRSERDLHSESDEFRLG